LDNKYILTTYTLFVLYVDFAIRKLFDGNFSKIGSILLCYGASQGWITGTREYSERTVQGYFILLALKCSGLHKTMDS